MMKKKNVQRLYAIQSAASGAVKKTMVNHYPLGEIAAGAVRGALLGCQEIGWDDPKSVAAAMTGVMRASGEILQAMSPEQDVFLAELSKLSGDAIGMALELDAAPVDAAEGAVIGAMSIVDGSDGDLFVQISAVTSGLVKGAAKVAGDSVGGVARGAVKGAVGESRYLGADASTVAYAAAQGAFTAAGEIGGDAPDQVRAALAAPIAGVDIVLPGDTH